MTWVFGSIPPPMDFNALTHTLSGTPTFAGAYTFTIYSDPVALGLRSQPHQPQDRDGLLRAVGLVWNTGWIIQLDAQGRGAVLSPGASGWDGFMIGAPSVIKVGGEFLSLL